MEIRNEKTLNIAKKILIIFLIIQPLLDIYYLYSDTVMNFVGFSPSTIIRMIMIFILFVLVIVSFKINKNYKWFIIYGFLLIIYFIFHHINAQNFNNIIGTYNYSIIEEAFYIVRMVLPLVVAYVTYNINLSSKQIEKIFYWIVFIISSFVIITNIFKISLPSYGTNEQMITANIFSWFNTSSMYTNVDISSRGLFMSANQLAALLIMTMPVIIYYIFKNKKNALFILLLLQIITCLMLGTRVSSYGWLAIMIVMFIIYIFMVFVKKAENFDKKMILKYIAVLVLMFALLQISPIQYRKFADDYADLSTEMDNSDVNPKTFSTEKQIEFIKENYDDYLLSEEFVEKIYNYEKNPEFWIDVMSLPYLERSDNRLIENYIMDDIYLQNDNNLDKFFGLSFSRLRSGGFYLEHDFLVHFYTLGVIGSLLLVYPYLILIAISIFIIFKRYKAKFNLEIITLIFSLTLMCFIAILSGSVLDQLLITLIGGFIAGSLVRKLYEKN